MFRLSECTKQFSKKDNFEDDSVKEFNDYRPESGFIKFFSSNNGTVVSSPSIDGGTVMHFIPRQYEITVKEVPQSGLADFIKYLEYKTSIGDIYTPLSFESYKNPLVIKGFSVKIKEYVKEKLRNPRVVFDYRIRQFVTYMNVSDPSVLTYSMYYAVQYIKEYFEQYLTAAMNGLVNSNIMMGLNISQYIANKQSVRVLQKYLRKAAEEIKAQGAMLKLTQKRLWDSFRSVFLELMTGISYRIKDSVKRTLLLEAVAGNAKNYQGLPDNSGSTEEVG